MLNGEIWLESEKNIGSKFSFMLPLSLDYTYNKNETTINSLENITKSTGKSTILIAEDNDDNFILVEYILKKLNYQIVRAMDGLQAVEICKTNKDLEFVLMDIKMPNLNGFEAQKQIKEFNPSLPIIACTAFSSSEFQKKISQAGFIDCLIKPLVKEDLFNIIEKIQIT